MATARSAASILSAVRTRCRREMGDPATDPAGVSISTQLLAWQDTEIDASINDQLIEMGTIATLQFPGDALLYTDLVLTDDSTSPGIALPSGVDSNAVYKVTDVTSSDASPKLLQYVAPNEIETYSNAVLETNDFGRSYYSLIGSTTGYRIIVRPLRVGDTIRIWYVAPPLTHSDGADNVVLSERWRELIALGAAFRLLSINEEAPDQLAARYQIQSALFKAACSRQQNSQRIKLIAGKYRS